MTIQSNLRRNPINGSISWRAMDPETHIIAELSEVPGLHGFQLQDKPEPGSVVISTGGTDYDQVTHAPLPGQVFIDYIAGFCIFNVADDGETTITEYNGGGSNSNTANILALGLQGLLLSNIVSGQNESKTTTVSEIGENLKSGFYRFDGVVNTGQAPTDDLYHIICTRSSNLASKDLFQLASRYDSNDVYFRIILNTTPSPWIKIANTQNLSNQQIPYSDTNGNLLGSANLLFDGSNLLVNRIQSLTNNLYLNPYANGTTSRRIRLFYNHPANTGAFHLHNISTGGTANVNINSYGRIRTASSSKRYKKNIRKIPKWLNSKKLYELIPIMYRDIFTDEEEKYKQAFVGLIAEDVYPILPYLVGYNEKLKENGKLEKKINRVETVLYDRLPVLMLVELKEHEESMEKLKIENELLKTRLDDLEERLTALETI